VRKEAGQRDPDAPTWVLLSCRAAGLWGALSCSALTPPRHARRYDLDKDEKVSFEEILQADEALRKEEEAGEGEDEEVQ
jgi:hypothetical protein